MSNQTEPIRKTEIQKDQESFADFRPSGRSEQIPFDACSQCAASVLEDEILEEIHLNIELPENRPFDPAALQACILAVQQAGKSRQSRQMAEATPENEKLRKKTEPVRFESSAFRRIRNLITASSRQVLMIQGLGLLAISIGSWILSLGLAEEMVHSPQTAAGLAIGYTCSAGMLLALICLAARIHAAAYGMDELEAACPWNASARLRYRIPAFALISLGGLCLVSLNLSGAENLKVLMLGGALCFLLTMLGSLITQGSLNGMLMSGILSLLCLLVFDFVSGPGLSAFLSQNGTLCCAMLIMAILALLARRRRQFS